MKQFVVMALFVVAPALLVAQGVDRVEIGKKAKAATALVEVSGGLQHGSAFCVHASGLFLTNSHVVDGAKDVKIILNSSLKNEEIVKAFVVREDKNLDLALLRIEDKATIPVPLGLGSSEELAELTEVIAVGFPFGKNLAFGKDNYPAVSVNLGRITSLRFNKGQLERIQLDAAINPGNSGGPVLDVNGKVVGVVVSGVKGAAVNFAIPVSHVRRFLAKPDVDVALPAISFENRFKPAEFKVRVAKLVSNGETDDVEVIISLTNGKKREFKMTASDGLFRAKIAVLQPNESPSTVGVVFTYESGKLEGTTFDRAIKIGTKETKLSSLQRLSFSPIPTATLANGKTLTGNLGGLERLTVTLGAETFTIDPTRAVDMTIQTEPEVRGVEVTVVVRGDKKEFARITKYLGFLELPADVTSKPASSTRKAHDSNLVRNGSFEQGPAVDSGRGYRTLNAGSAELPEWTVTHGDIDVNTTLWQHADGDRSLDMNGYNRGGISQTIPTVVGKKYFVTFWMAGNPNPLRDPRRMRVSAAGTQADFSFDDDKTEFKNMGWVKRSWTFTANDSKTTLTFDSLVEEGNGPALDNVIVVPFDGISEREPVDDTQTTPRPSKRDNPNK